MAVVRSTKITSYEMLMWQRSNLAWSVLVSTLLVAGPLVLAATEPLTEPLERASTPIESHPPAAKPPDPSHIGRGHTNLRPNIRCECAAVLTPMHYGSSKARSTKRPLVSSGIQSACAERGSASMASGEGIGAINSKWTWHPGHLNRAMCLS